MKLPSPVLLTVLVLCACSAVREPTRPRGAVGVREVDPVSTSAARLELAANESFQRPLFAAYNALPQYPDALLAYRLAPQPVCVRVGISETGSVMQAEAVIEGPDCAATGAAAPELVAAARDATLRWRFDPAFRCVHPRGEQPQQGLCSGDGAREIPQAVSLVYRFVFEQHAGHGQVRLHE